MYNFNMTDELKFVWAYLLKYGRVTNGKWCFYGGNWEYLDERYPSWGEAQKQRKELLDKVLKAGIDWNKTKVPEVTERSAFTDTFSDPREELATLGTLYLKNGEKLLIGSDANEAASLAEAARELMKPDSDLIKLAAKL